MEYLYHRVPDNMVGTILYPLNILKEKNPEIYTEHVKKYEGREELLQSTIPPLNCLWNDVLHFAAVSPQELKSNLVKADTDLPPSAWYKIPVSMLEGDKTIVFKYRRDISLTPDFREYENFDPANINTYKIVPEETIEYYKRKKEEGVRPLLFHQVPQILFKGTIDIKDLEIVYP